MNAAIAHASEVLMTGSAGHAAVGHSRRAVVDIGTNSVKLLLADVIGKRVEPILETSEQTRLGRGLYAGHLLRPDAMEATTAAVARFVAQARRGGAGAIRILATSAVREAGNAGVLTDAIHQTCGLEVVVISGDTEAGLVFRGVTMNADFGSGPLLILDVGGGSTEFSVGCGDQCLLKKSYPLGSVRLLETANLTDPPGLACRQQYLDTTSDFLARNVAPALEASCRGNLPGFLVGTGGSATILARLARSSATFNRDAIESTRLTRVDVSREVSRLWQVSVRERQAMAGIPPERADIIIMGAVIYEAVMKVFRLDQLRFTTRGLRFAALLELA